MLIRNELCEATITKELWDVITHVATNQELSRVFGTRHRAALGLSEETDAILIVVSEERRDISIIYQRKFYKDLGVLQLEGMIKELLKTDEHE